MAVYERTYKPYTGVETAPWSRFLVLPRFAYREVFNSRLFLSFFVACFIVPLGMALLIYLPHNLKFLEMFNIQAVNITSFLKYDGAFFLGWFMAPQGLLSFILCLVLGPALVSNDLNNNGLALYLSRPFSRKEYVVGKMSVMVILLSAITWIPGLLLFFLQAYFGGWEWLSEHVQVGLGIFFGMWIWILILCLLSLAFSAYLRWKPLARAALFGVWFVGGAASVVATNVLKTKWGAVLNISEMIHVVWVRMLGVDEATSVPLWGAWIALLSVCGICLVLLARKIKAYEVVS